MEQIVAFLPYTLDAAWNLTPCEIFACQRAIHLKLGIDGDADELSEPTLTREEFEERKAQQRAFFEAKYPGRFTWKD